MKFQATIGIIIMAALLILYILGLLPPIVLLIGGIIGIYLFLSGMKKEKKKPNKK